MSRINIIIVSGKPLVPVNSNNNDVKFDYRCNTALVVIFIKEAMMEKRNQEIELWIKDLTRWKESGLTQQKWCADNGISYSAFRYRKMKAEKYMKTHTEDLEKANEEKTVNLIKVPGDINANDSYHVIEIVAKGLTIRATNEASPLVLKSVIEEVLNA